MLDHMNLIVSDLAKSRGFFATALAPLGYKVLYDIPEGVGFGVDHPILWINPGTVGRKMHVAFAAPTRALVKRHSMMRRSPRVARTMARPAFDRSIIAITTVRSCSIPMATTSRRFAAAPNEVASSYAS